MNILKHLYWWYHKVAANEKYLIANKESEPAKSDKIYLQAYPGSGGG